MTRQHHLGATLRKLKLSGMLETLDARLGQARAGELGHLEFLQVLCEDEISRREGASLLRRVRQARFEETVTLEDFNFSFNPKVPAALTSLENDRRWRAFFLPMVFMMDILSGASPLIVDVRQTGSGPMGRGASQRLDERLS